MLPRFILGLLTIISFSASADFTKITPSADSKIIYVSDSQGNDLNDCLFPATPCKTLAKATSKTRLGYPDHVYLKRGDIWYDQYVHGIKSGRSVTEPAVVAFYGDVGDRPVIAGGGVSISQNKYSIKKVNFIGLNFYAYKMDNTNPVYTGTSQMTVKLLAGNEDILFEDCAFTYSSMTLQGFDGGIPKRVKLRRNIFNGAFTLTSSYSQSDRPSNLYANNVDGLLIEENIFDHGGWHETIPGAAANMYNHNLYLQTGNVGNNILVRGNIITRASSHGIHGRAGGIYTDNFFAQNAVSLQLGYSGTPILTGTKAYAFDNVITEGHSMIKGITPCSGTNLCTGAVWGLVTEDVQNADLQISGNISQGHAVNDTQWVGILPYGLQFKTLDVSNGWSLNAQYGKTLADYNQHLGGNNSFEDFINSALNRKLQTWNESMSAKSINAYIRSDVCSAIF